MTNDVPETEETRRKGRYRDIVTGVFGLVLALGAFSVTTADFDSTGDVWLAISIFSPAFFFVLAIWQTTAELFDRYPVDDHLFYTLVTLVLFLSTLSPAFLNLLLSEADAVQRLAGTLFPLSMATIFAILALLWLRLRGLDRRRGLSMEGDTTGGALAAGVLSALFLVSLLAPFRVDDDSPRTYIWFAGFVVPDIALWLRRRATLR
jgi:hypothetical protein